MSAHGGPKRALSPCTGVCTMADGLCIGCGRTLAEIAGWGGLTDEERAAIMRALPERRAKPGSAPVLPESTKRQKTDRPMQK